MVERGLEGARNRRTVSNEEMLHRIQDVVELNWTVEAQRYSRTFSTTWSQTTRRRPPVSWSVSTTRSSCCAAFLTTVTTKRVTPFPLVGNHESATRVGANMQAEATVQGDDFSIPHAQRHAPSTLPVGRDERGGSLRHRGLQLS
jgi:hypothetical protein